MSILLEVVCLLTGSYIYIKCRYTPKSSFTTVLQYSTIATILGILTVSCFTRTDIIKTAHNRKEKSVVFTSVMTSILISILIYTYIQITSTRKSTMLNGEKKEN